MAVSLKSISRGRAILAPRLILLGTEKVGKSTFASHAPSPIFIPIIRETGLNEIDAPKFPAAQSLADVVSAIGEIGTTDEFKTVVIDSASALEPLIWKATCDEHNATSIETVLKGFNKGKVEALKYWGEVTAGLDWLQEKGIGSIIVGHAKVKSFNDPLSDPYDSYLFDIDQQAAAMLARWADGILFANIKTIGRQHDVGGKKVTHAVAGERILYCGKRPGLPTGTRYAVPAEMPFNFAAWQSALDASRTQ